MRTLWLEGQQLSLIDAPTPEISGEALIRIRLAGICGTDLELVRGYYPFTGIPGHEFVGEVVTAPEAGWIGKRVVGEINIPCGECEQCVHGRTSHCERRSVLGIIDRNGVHAEYTTLPLSNLHLVPDGIADEAAVFVEPLAAALQIQEQVSVQAADRVLLVGAGRLGQLIAQTLALTGCELSVVARHPLQQKLLTARSIAVIEPEKIQPRSWDLVVEATGSPSGFDLACQALRPRGTLVLKSTYHGEMSVAWSPFVVNEITIIGSRCGPFQPALRLLETKQVDPTVLIAKKYPLTAGVDAYETARQSGMLKVLLVPSG